MKLTVHQPGIIHRIRLRYIAISACLVDDLVEFRTFGHTIHGVRRTADRVHAQVHFVEIAEAGRNEPELRRAVIEPDGEGLLRRRHVEVLGVNGFFGSHRCAVVD